jgi:hypothetical protein
VRQVHVRGALIKARTEIDLALSQLGHNEMVVVMDPDLVEVRSRLDALETRVSVIESQETPEEPM